MHSGALAATQQQSEDGHPLLLHSLLTSSSLHWHHERGGSREPQRTAGSFFGASSLPYIQLASAAETGDLHEQNKNLRGDSEEEEAEEGREHEAEVEPEEKKEEVQQEVQQHEITESVDSAAAAAAVDNAAASSKQEAENPDPTTQKEGQRARGRPGEKFRDEYKPSDFLIDSVGLKFVLDDAETEVSRKSRRKLMTHT